MFVDQTMRRRIRIGLAILLISFLAAAICKIASSTMARNLSIKKGVAVQEEDNGPYIAENVNDVFEKFRKDGTAGDVTFSFYQQGDGRPTFVVAGDGQRRVFIDASELRFFRRVAQGMAEVALTSGWHQVHVSYTPDPKSFAALKIYESYDSRTISDFDCFVKPLSPAESRRWLVSNSLGRAFRILTFVPLSLLFLLVLLWLAKIVLQPFLAPGIWTIPTAVLILLAIVARFEGIQYLLPEGLHPDERAAQGAVYDVRHQKEVRQFRYSYGFYYLSAGIESLLYEITGRDPPPHLAIRILSAVSSVVLCLLIYLFTARNLDRIAANCALGLSIFLFVPFEVSHWGIIEPTFVSFFFLAFLLISELTPNSSWKNYVVAGFVSGLSVGVKQTGLLIAIPFFCLWIYQFRKRIFSVQALKLLFLFIAIATLGYFVFSFSFLLHVGTFLKQQLWEIRSLEGEAQSQYFYATSGLPLFLTMLRQGFGYPLVFATITGAMLLIWKRNYRLGFLILPFLTFYVVLLFESKALVFHYLLLLLPFFAFLVAVVLSTIKLGRSRYFLLIVLGVVLLLPSLKKDARLMKILLASDTRERAERFCYQNLPGGKSMEIEFFGPRILIPIFKVRKVPLFNKNLWKMEFAMLVDYYIEDSLSSDVYTNFPKKSLLYRMEKAWHETLHSNGELIEAFRGPQIDPEDLYNPEIRLYSVSNIRKPIRAPD